MENLRIFGTNYSDVSGIKATNQNDDVVAYYSASTFATAELTNQIKGGIFLENTGNDLRGYAFYGLKGITSVYAPNLTGTEGTGYCFYQCTGLTSIDIPSATGFGQRCFMGCTGLTTVVLKAGIHCWSYNFASCTNLTAIDYAGIDSSQGTFDGNGFNGSTKLATLIIRNTTAAKLSNINCFTNTPFASGKTGGTLYVPSSLISTYQSASNWSTILGYERNSIQAIEGSVYETKYADGTSIT